MTVGCVGCVGCLHHTPGGALDARGHGPSERLRIILHIHPRPLSIFRPRNQCYYSVTESHEVQAVPFFLEPPGVNGQASRFRLYLSATEV
nr:MAG TPA: hypothetical protein [Caudoviricetes sp.]